MTQTNTARWHAMRNDESRLVEKVLREAGFEQVDAYSYNPASIRVRVIDSRFEGLSEDEREAWLDEHIKKLPEDIRADIITLLTFAPSEIVPKLKLTRQLVLNWEFEEVTSSEL